MRCAPRCTRRHPTSSISSRAATGRTNSRAPSSSTTARWQDTSCTAAPRETGARTMTARGKLITLEGIDGAGKSSHVGFLRERIAARGVEVAVTREPGGTPFGEKLRDVILHHPAGALAE